MRIDDERVLNHFAKNWYRFPSVFLAVITRRGETRKGRAAPNEKKSKLTAVETVSPGFTAMRIAERNMGAAHGAAIRAYIRPKMNAPK